MTTSVNIHHAVPGFARCRVQLSVFENLTLKVPKKNGSAKRQILFGV
jgi:hypothetical protein